MPVLEAMASGLAVVATRCLGVNSFCQHLLNCLLADPLASLSRPFSFGSKTRENEEDLSELTLCQSGRIGHNLLLKGRTLKDQYRG